ncbi:F-box-like/WD repeat-containing protein TBL1XR1 [Daphnia pulex]|uniref:F-box-like/WD repeat-containing protein TBL1XR1 n=1 Tax=Daphnia pulex TaxID=6669 RepID=UPI001EDF4AF5|nr:F-box-like/WD repeat-containing protein TBL1XR1 [Daphnia pulex]
MPNPGFGSSQEVTEQPTTKLHTSSRQFKTVARLVRERGEDVVSRFHPKKPVIACGIKNEIIFFSAENCSIPFSNWKNNGNKFQIGHEKEIMAIEWNVDGTQLAAISIFSSEIIVWSYPDGKVLFQKELEKGMDHIEWNPFMPNIFATFPDDFGTKVFFFNSCPVDQRPFHFCTIEYEKIITSFQWISANRVALGLRGDRRIEIWEIDESMTSAKIVKRLEYESDYITNVAWDERTKCLAACYDDGWITIWSMDSDQPIHTTKVDGECRSLAWRPNRKQTDDEGVDAARKSTDNFILACGFGQRKIVIWTPLKKKKTRFLIKQHSSVIDWLSFSPDGRFLASSDVNGKLISSISFRSAEDWKPVFIKKKHIRGGRFSKHFSWSSSSSTDVPDYKLTFNSNDGKIRVVEYAEGQ